MAGLNGTIKIRSGEYRPCAVNGQKALFHRWVNKEQILLKCNSNLKPEGLISIRKNYEATGVVPDSMTIDKIKATAAIVEFEDGIVKEVSVTDIKFLDSRNVFFENEALFYEHVGWGERSEP